MSVVVMTPGPYEPVRQVVDAIRAQTARARLELVFVTPSRDALALTGIDLDGFAGVVVTEIDALDSSPAARAAGVRAATAPVVAFTEDHCFPEPEWAEALLREHDQPWAGVGPAVLNGNPVSVVTWANLLPEYGGWLHPVAGGEYAHIPGHNSSYKRDVLLQYGDRLPVMLEAESAMQWDLRARGHRFAIAPRARIRHMNFSRVGPSLGLRFNCGRLFAANRARSWTAAARLVFCCAAPAIPAVRLWRALRDLRRIGRLDLLPRLLPALVAFYAVDGLGELAGYALGAGNANRRITETEFCADHFGGRR
jgi:hypothetical protein